MTHERAAALEFLRKQLLTIKASGPDGFEGLVAMCLATISGLVFRLAKSGSQFGRDASSLPDAFAIAMEAKRYTKPPRVELIAGKAVVAGYELRDDIDVWVLAVTAEVGDNTAATLTKILTDNGITSVVLDWANSPLPPLAVALAAAKASTLRWFEQHAPSCDTTLLSRHLSVIAADDACVEQANQIRRLLSAAHAGLDALRQRSREWLQERHVDHAKSQISFGQYVTVSAPNSFAVPRPLLIDAVGCAVDWSLSNQSVIAIVGEEGAGKTWVVNQWWAGLPSQPIMILVAGRRASFLNTADPLEGLARLLTEQAGEGESAVGGWRKRLLRWQQPNNPGELRFVLVLDGLNEHPKQEWADIIKAYRPVVRSLGAVLMATSRGGYWKEEVAPRLPHLRHDFPITLVQVDGYSDQELTAVLARAKLTSADVPRRLREFIRNPRVCGVALGLLDRLKLQPNELTIERLLLSFWQARLEERGNLLKHNAVQFRSLLQSHARAFRAQPLRHFDRKSLADHSILDDVESDLTEIEEGRFLTVSSDGETYEFRNEALPFAIGLLVNDELKERLVNSHGAPTIDADEQLKIILEPVRSFDAVSAFVAAAVGLACLDDGFPNAGREALIRAWCGLQNINRRASDSLAAYLPACPDAFLNVIESNDTAPNSSSRVEFIVDALFTMRRHLTVESALGRRLPTWLGTWSRVSSSRVFSDSNPSSVKRKTDREARIRDAIHSLSQEELAVFRARTFETLEAANLQLSKTSALLLAGRPLAGSVSALLGWALAQAVAYDIYDAGEALSWVVRLNTEDHAATTAAIRRFADSLTVTSAVPFRTAVARLLRMSGDADSADQADRLRPFGPEERWRRVATFCDTNPHDPDAQPCSNLENARSALLSLVPGEVWSSSGQTHEDHNLDDITPALARFDPQSLVAHLRDIVRSASERAAYPLRQLGLRIQELSPIFDSECLAAIRRARRRLQSDSAPLSDSEFLWLNANLACGELPHLTADEQLDVIIDLPADTPAFTDLQRGLKPLPAAALEARIAAALERGDREELTRVFFFAHGSIPEVSESARAAILHAVDDPDELLSNIAAELVCRANDAELDAMVINRAANANWAFDSSKRYWYHARTVAVAASRRKRKDAIGFIQPQYFGAMTEALGERVVEMLSAATERALERALMLPVAQIDVRQHSEAVVADDDLPIIAESDARLARSVSDFERGLNMARDRQRSQLEALQTYEGALINGAAPTFTSTQQVDSLQSVIDRHPDRYRVWLERIEGTTEPRRLRQVRDLGIAIAGAYAKHDGSLAVKVLVHLRGGNREMSVVGSDLFAFALFTAGDVESLSPLRESLFAEAFTDQAIEAAVIAADSGGASDWLTRFVKTLIGSVNPGDQARALTIAGLRSVNAVTDQILHLDWGKGFLGDVAAFSRKNSQRDGWARHWITAALRSDDAIDFWRFSKLAEGVVDMRFCLWRHELLSTERWHGFVDEVFERFDKAAEARSQRRAKTLFGLNAPDADVVRAFRSERDERGP